MKRVIAALLTMTGLLVGLIAWQIRAQDEAARAPAGGSGVVESEGVDVAARLAARVLRVDAREGTRVQKGDALLTLECDEPEARLAEARARLAAARAQVAGARSQAQAARGQSAAAAASVTALDGQLGALSAQRELAERDAQRLETMGEYAAASARDRARSTANGLTEQQRAARASEQVSRRQAGAASAQASAAEAQALAAEQTVGALDALVRSAQLATDECVVRAPLAGIVERIHFDPGELVLFGAHVARVVDPARVNITFYLSNADLAEARLGGRAEVLADAYPGRTFVGTITRLALEAEFTPRNVQTRSDRDRLVYPVEVSVTEHGDALRSGMQATVSLEGAP